MQAIHARPPATQPATQPFSVSSRNAPPGGALRDGTKKKQTTCYLVFWQNKDTYYYYYYCYYCYCYYFIQEPIIVSNRLLFYLTSDCSFFYRLPNDVSLHVLHVICSYSIFFAYSRQKVKDEPLNRQKPISFPFLSPLPPSSPPPTTSHRPGCSLNPVKTL